MLVNVSFYLEANLLKLSFLFVDCSYVIAQPLAIFVKKLYSLWVITLFVILIGILLKTQSSWVIFAKKNSKESLQHIVNKVSVASW